jgi:outer membrane protein assembly factor BamB
MKKKPPDGLLPVTELSRLAYSPRDNPRALLYGNHLLVVGQSGFVEGHDAATGTFTWKLGLPGEKLFDPVVFEAGPLVSGVTGEFTVVLSEPSGHILLVDGLTGEIVSETRLAFELALPPIRGPEDIVFLASPSGDIVAYDVGKGVVVFQTATGERPHAIAHAGSIVVVSGASQTLTALELPQGRIRWTFRGRAGFYAAAAFDSLAARVYIGDDTGEFYCLDATEGSVKFRWSTGAAIRNAALVEGERIYLASYANTLFAFNARSGDEHWRANLPGRPATGPMRVRERLLVATFDGILIEINPQRGQPGKRYTAPSEIVFAPSFFLATPSPEERAAETQQEVSRDTDEPASPFEAEDGDGLDPAIFGPAELTVEPADADTSVEVSTVPELEAPEDAAPEEPAWFERSRIAMALRSGEVLLLSHNASQPTPANDRSRDGEPLGDVEDPASKGEGPPSGSDVPF